MEMNKRARVFLKFAAAAAVLAALGALAARTLGEAASAEARLAKADGELYTPAYLDLREKLAAKYRCVLPGRFGEAVKGVTRRLPEAAGKTIALTLDACGGEHSRGYNSGLINFLRAEKIPATLFVSSLWIDRHPSVFMELARDPGFEIESHGYLHRACSVS